MTKRVTVLPLLMVAGLVLLSGCQSMTYTTSPQHGVLSGKSATAGTGSLHVKRTAHYMFWGLLPVSTPELDEVAATRLGANQALTGIVIEEHNSFLNGFLAAITYGIYRPRTIEFSGTIVTR